MLKNVMVLLCIATRDSKVLIEITEGVYKGSNIGED
jgi:hypothetical protein